MILVPYEDLRKTKRHREREREKREKREGEGGTGQGLTVFVSDLIIFYESIRLLISLLETSTGELILLHGVSQRNSWCLNPLLHEDE